MSASELTFSSSSPDPKVITVTAVEDVRYAGDRSATLILTADGYTMATVTVDITEDDSRPVVVDENYADGGSATLTLTTNGYTTETVTVEIPEEDDPQSAGLDPQLAGLNPQSTELRVESTVLNLVSFESTKVEVRVASATLNVDSSTKPAVARATASTPTLMITASTVLDIAAHQTTAELTVTVRAADPATNITNITLMATVTSATDVASVTPASIPVPAGTPTMFTVRGLATGTATLTLTADHPDYEPAITTVRVDVSRPEVLRFRIKVFLEGML